MPTYEYACLKCNNFFEEAVNYMERHNVICPKCSSKNVQLLPSIAYLVFKGVGFYVNDYSKKKTSKSI